MKWNSLFRSNHFLLILAALFLLGSIPKNASAQTILNTDNNVINVSVPDGNSITDTPGEIGFLAGSTTFDLATGDIPNVELLADLFTVDAGVNIVVNGTQLFDRFTDLSQFGFISVFENEVAPGFEGAAEGNINSPFTPNTDPTLPRLSINSTSAGTTFSGTVDPGTTAITTFPPAAALTDSLEDFTSLLQVGSNTIEFFALNDNDLAFLDGEFTVTLNAINPIAVPEPSSISILLLLGTCLVTKRRR